MEKKLDGNYTKMQWAILNKSWRQHHTKLQLYGLLPPITKTIKIRRTRYAGHGWRSREELIRDVHQWTPLDGRAKTGWPARTYIQLLSADTGCSPEDLPEAMDDREGWRERVMGIRADRATWWWWWWVIVIIIILNLLLYLWLYRLFVSYNISIFVDNPMPNPFFIKETVLFLKNQFHESTVSMSKTVLFQTIQFSIHK